MTKKNLFRFLCLLGCIYQLSDILNLYFKYETITQVSVEQEDEITPVDVTLCSRIQELLNGPVKIDRNVSDTIKKYFEFTPAIESVMNGCMIRKPNRYGFMEINSKECYSYFNVT